MILKPDKIATSPGSYRPISLLPVIGKLMEKIMTQRIAKLMLQNGLLMSNNILVPLSIEIIA